MSAISLPDSSSFKVRIGEITLSGAVSGSGETLLLIHGLAGSARWWSRNIPALEQHFRVIAFDLPGFGDISGYVALEEIVDGIATEIAASSQRPFHIMGHSMGGLITTGIAGRYPELVHRLVLVDAAFMNYDDHLLHHVAHVVRTVPDTGIDEFSLLAHDAVRANPVALAKSTANLLRTDWGDLLPLITAPALVVWGEEDRVVPLSTGEQIAATIPGAELVVLPGAGHNSMFEAPEQFNEITIAFLQGVG